jgi:hypothetical protein
MALGVFMKKIGFIAMAFVFWVGFAPAKGHGTAEAPIAPANLTDESIIHRLKQLGYSEIKIVRASSESVDVELQRAGERFGLTVSRRLIGPGSLATYDVVQVVERLLKPLVPQTIPTDIDPATPKVPK